MELEELENNLNELEMRVDRVRALYEQYFMGIEKIEPAVLRKDIDRRFWILRREQIRNTAMRFKLNTISQRYNTYQQYWGRIIREIEQGTYKRHVRKAEQRFGKEALTIAARRRLGRTAKDAEDERQVADAAEKAERALAQIPDIDAYEVEVDLAEFADIDDIDDLLAPRSARRVEVGKARPAAPALDELDDLESLMGLGSSTPRAPRQPLPQRTPPAQRTAPPRPAAPSGDDGFGKLDGVFAEEDDDQTQPRHMPKFDRMAGAQSARPQPPTPTAPPRPAPPRAPLPPPQRSQAPAPPQPPRPQAQQAPPRPLPPQPSARPPTQQAPARPPPPQSAPSAVSAPPRPAAAPPQRAATAPPRQSAIGRTSRAAPDALSDDRVRQIYRDYVQAKRNCNESTSSVTEDALASTLRSSAAKLRSKHKGKQVDFDVVIKDGKAVLKPIVKS